IERYDAVLTAMDVELQRLVDALDDQRDRTTIIVIGDNGTPSAAVRDPRDPGRQKHSLFEGGVNVPLVVTGPHVAEPGAVSNALVSVVDIFPTVAHIAGVPLSGPDETLEVDVGAEARPLDGRSWLPVLADPDQHGADYVYLESFLPHGAGPHTGVDRRMVTDGHHKLVRDMSGDHLYRIDRERIADPDGPDLWGTDELSADSRTAADALARLMDDLDATVGFEGR
ncbi:MAG: sulfatase-like hydrolase/transferase, partial [Planctomycetota bacterium]